MTQKFLMVLDLPQKSKKRFLPILGRQSQVAPSGGSNPLFNFLNGVWDLRSHYLYKMFFATTLPLAAFLIISTPHSS